jgi:hypothetical protein
MKKAGEVLAHKGLATIQVRMLAEAESLSEGRVKEAYIDTVERFGEEPYLFGGTWSDFTAYCHKLLRLFSDEDRDGVKKAIVRFFELVGETWPE